MLLQNKQWSVTYFWLATLTAADGAGKVVVVVAEGPLKSLVMMLLLPIFKIPLPAILMLTEYYAAGLRIKLRTEVYSVEENL